MMLGKLQGDVQKLFFSSLCSIDHNQQWMSIDFHDKTFFPQPKPIPYRYFKILGTMKFLKPLHENPATIILASRNLKTINIRWFPAQFEPITPYSPFQNFRKLKPQSFPILCNHLIKKPHFPPMPGCYPNITLASSPRDEHSSKANLELEPKNNITNKLWSAMLAIL